MTNRKSIDRRTALKTMGLASAALMSPFPVFADTFPGQQAIRIVSPFAPGGPTDIIARIFADALSTELDSTVFVENIPGASGTVGTGRIARTKPDGHTLVVSSVILHYVAPTIIGITAYDPTKDFTPVAKIADTGLLIIAHPDFPANTTAELIELARQSSDPLLYATWGQGSGPHMMMEAIADHANIEMEQVPYKGVSSVITAVLGGEIQVGTATADTAIMQHLRSGKLKALSISSGTRWHLMPDIATLEEQGIPLQLSTWYGLFTPSGMSAHVTESLNTAVRNTLNDPALQEKLSSLGLEVAPPLDHEDFLGLAESDAALWLKLYELTQGA